MMSYEVKKRNIYYCVGRYRLDNKQDAEHLAETLNNLNNEEKLDQIQKKVIQLQMSISIIADELETLHKEVIR